MVTLKQSMNFIDYFNETLRYLFEWMINTANIPKLFNISILKPLIKDTTKGYNDVNNLRPLSISDAYTNIFEKLLLNELKTEHPDHHKQLGFKSNLAKEIKCQYSGD